jgi:hypothetical protein
MVGSEDLNKGDRKCQILSGKRVVLVDHNDLIVNGDDCAPWLIE